jgi:uncharacterized protein GlcG (DUF336 family)
MPASSTAATGAKAAPEPADKPLCRLLDCGRRGGNPRLVPAHERRQHRRRDRLGWIAPERGGNGREFMPYALRLAGLAGLMMTLVPPSAGVAQVLMQRDVSLKMALTIAEAAVAECDKTGNSVSVAVVDRAGRLRVFLQGDKAAPHNIELAQRKAYTARTFGRTSADWASRTEPGSELSGQRQLEHVIALRGGVPIKVGDDTIGAVGVSGSTSGGDEACAMAGVASVQEQLK